MSLQAASKFTRKELDLVLLTSAFITANVLPTTQCKIL